MKLKQTNLDSKVNLYKFFEHDRSRCVLDGEVVCEELGFEKKYSHVLRMLSTFLKSQVEYWKNLVLYKSSLHTKLVANYHLWFIAVRKDYFCIARIALNFTGCLGILILYDGNSCPSQGDCFIISFSNFIINESILHCLDSCSHRSASRHVPFIKSFITVLLIRTFLGSVLIHKNVSNEKFCQHF